MGDVTYIKLIINELFTRVAQKKPVTQSGYREVKLH